MVAASSASIREWCRFAGTWQFEDLTPLSYDVILADLATHFETRSGAGKGKSPQAQHPTMAWNELAALRVAELGRGDTLLMLWACWPTLRQSMALLYAWGFRYVTGGAWHKRTRHSKSAFGTGYVLRSASEPYLIGTLGTERRERSRKPDAQYDYCERFVSTAVRFRRALGPPAPSQLGQLGQSVDMFGETA